MNAWIEDWTIFLMKLNTQFFYYFNYSLLNQPSNKHYLFANTLFTYCLQSSLANVSRVSPIMQDIINVLSGVYNVHFKITPLFLSSGTTLNKSWSIYNFNLLTFNGFYKCDFFFCWWPLLHQRPLFYIGELQVDKLDQGTSDGGSLNTYIKINMLKISLLWTMSFQTQVTFLQVYWSGLLK